MTISSLVESPIMRTTPAGNPERVAPQKSDAPVPEANDSFNIETEIKPAPPERSSAWTLPLLCAGIAILACCLIIPAADDNRRLAYERQKLSADLDQLKKQVDVNSQFLKSVGEDPALLERLAQRQMKMVRDGSSVLDLKDENSSNDLSPYLLLSVPTPPAQAEYRPIGGHFAQLCRAPRSRLFIMGGALLAIAFGLISGEAGNQRETELAID